MPKDFDTTLLDAATLAGRAAQTAGAQAVRTEGRKRNVRKRTALTAMSLVLVAAGTVAVVQAASSSGSTPHPASTGSPGPSPSSPVLNPVALKNLLVPVPSGATPLAPRQGTSGGEITVDQYVANDYPGDGSLQAGATKQILRTLGFESAVVQWYRDAQGDDIEYYLIQFSGSGGAMGYGLGLANMRMQSGGAAEFADATAASGYGFTSPAATGYTEADLFGYSGDVVAIVHVFARNGGEQTTAASVFASQYSAIHTAQ